MGRPLILAQALTCSTFLWGLSQLCQTHPGSGARAAPGPQWEVWGGGGGGGRCVLKTLGKRDRFRKGKAGPVTRKASVPRSGFFTDPVWRIK